MSEYKPFFHFLIIIHSLFYATSDLWRHCRALKILPTASQWPAFREKPRLEKITYVLPSSSTHLNEFNKKKASYYFLLLLFTVYFYYYYYSQYTRNTWYYLFIILSNEITLPLFSLFALLYKTCISLKFVICTENYCPHSRKTRYARIETRFPCCLP